jgi:hypothetical protein
MERGLATMIATFEFPCPDSGWVGILEYFCGLGSGKAAFCLMRFPSGIGYIRITVLAYYWVEFLNISSDRALVVIEHFGWTYHQ